MPEIGNLFVNRSVRGNPTHELYNIAEDPHEDNNVAAQYPEKVEELKAVWIVSMSLRLLYFGK